MRLRNKSKLVLRISLLTLVFTLIYSCDTTEPLFDKYSPSGAYSISWDNLPKLGGGDDLRLGGFVGLFYKNNRTFYTVTNRGPVVQKLDENGSSVYFPLSSFTPSIVELELQDDNTIKVVNQIEIRRPGGFNTTGLLPPNSWNSDEVVTNSDFTEDDWGIYPGGVLLDVSENFFWISDQYNPALMQVTADGEWGRRLRPAEGLRRAFGNQTVNGGLTGIDINSDGRFVTLMGRCLENNVNPENPDNVINYAMRRVVLVNQENNTDLSMFYFVEPESYDGIPEQFVTLGDIATVNDTSYLVTEYAYYNGIERNLLFLVAFADSTTKAVVGFEGIIGKTFETLSPSEWRINELYSMKKYLLMDLSTTDIKRPDGIAIINENNIALIDNNQFGITNSNPYSKTYTLDKSAIKLEIITLPNKLELK